MRVPNGTPNSKTLYMSPCVPFMLHQRNQLTLLPTLWSDPVGLIDQAWGHPNHHTHNDEENLQGNQAQPPTDPNRLDLLAT